MTPLKITVFGMPRMEHAGNALDISRRKVVALAAYLAVTGQPQSRDTLAALLWPEYDQASARSNLRRDLSRLKRLMGGEHLKVERNQVELVQGPGLWLDVSEFEKALSQIREHHPEARQLCETCATVLAEAVALYQDDFLAGFAVPDSAAFDEWQFFRREELRQALAGALQRLIDWHVASGQVDRGIGYGRRWVALDPLHEPAQRRLMQLYAWSGQQSAALRQYQESVRLLREELGVEPEEETIALYEAIRSRQLTAPRSRTGPKDRKAEGRYELLDLLAVGGHAEVYYGRDRENQADVVIKRLKPELLVRDPIYLERFIREATALSQLEHPNIVRMLATFEEDGQHSIVMEYVPGGSLRQLLDREGPLPIPQALAIALELADALARAHHLNIIHRDLKPDNVLLGANGAPRLTDFGLARLRRDDGRLTRTGTVLGSPAYMSPEALRGETLDARSDIWSFGVLLYEMIAGRKPFDGEQLTPVLVSILQDEAPPVTVFRAAAPPALAALLQQLLQKERALRPPSMRQVAAQLEAIAVGSALLPADTDEKSAPAKLSREALPNSPPRQAAQEARAEPPPHGLPIPRSPLVGRQREVGELCSLLAQGQGQRLVTLVGPGGMGKTRLALAVAAEMAPSFADGVFFVPLAALTTADQLVTAIAESTGLRFVGNDAFDRQLMNYLRQRRALLLLDNFDHVLDGLPLVAALLEKAPELCLLVTSRERLNLAGEQVYTLHGLPFPAVGSGVQEEDAGSYGAVQLLVQQAQRQMPGYTPDGKELAAAARIAQLVEGMPLPLLLAASWLSLLSFAEIAGEISADIDFLASEARDLPPRQRSMRAVFEGSWERLEEDEREIVVKLSAFHGVFDRAAAEAVAGGHAARAPWPAAKVMDTTNRRGPIPHPRAAATVCGEKAARRRPKLGGGATTPCRLLCQAAGGPVYPDAGSCSERGVRHRGSEFWPYPPGMAPAAGRGRF